jgi:hypothetical protein
MYGDLPVPKEKHRHPTEQTFRRQRPARTFSPPSRDVPRGSGVESSPIVAQTNRTVAHEAITVIDADGGVTAEAVIPSGR